MNNISSKTKFFLSLVFLIAMVFVFLFLNQKINDNNKIAEEKLVEWETEFTRQEEIQSLNRSILAIETGKAELETHFARSSNVVPFLDSIENLAKQMGLEAGVSLVDVPKEEKNLIVEMKTVGNFSTIYKFLKLLENSSYEIELVSVNLQNTTSSDELVKDSKTEWEAMLRIKLLSFIK